MATYREFHRRSIEDRDAFWRDEAKLIEWQTPFSAVLDYSKPPFARWFVGGRPGPCAESSPCQGGSGRPDPRDRRRGNARWAPSA